MAACVRQDASVSTTGATCGHLKTRESASTSNREIHKTSPRPSLAPSFHIALQLQQGFSQVAAFYTSQLGSLKVQLGHLVLVQVKACLNIFILLFDSRPPQPQCKYGDGYHGCQTTQTSHYGNNSANVCLALGEALS